MPSIRGSRRRSSKQSSTSSSKHKKSPPPDLALKSRGSSNSTTSDTQATPRSIFSSSLRSSKRGQLPKDVVKPVTRGEALRSHPVTPVEKLGSTVDVFAFMEQDDVNWDSPPSITNGRIMNHSAASLTADEDGDHQVSPPILGAQPIEPPQASPRYSDLEVKADGGSHRPWERSSTFSDGGLHSDSGISMHSGSPDEDGSPAMQHKYPMIQEEETASPIAAMTHTQTGLSIYEEVLEADDPPSAIPLDSPDLPAQRIGGTMHRHAPSIETSEGLVPEACHVSSPAPPLLGPRILNVGGSHEDRRRSYIQPHLEIPPLDVNAPNPAALQFDPSNHMDAIPEPSQPSDQVIHSGKKTGYALLASKISAHRPRHPAPQGTDTVEDADEGGVNAEEDPPFLAPIYRKFETLTHRMLLYLQDEISELESQLSELDAAIALETHQLQVQQQQQPHHHHPNHNHNGHRTSTVSTSTTSSSAVHGVQGVQPVQEARRLDAKLPSRLQWHRADLLGRVGGRLEVYQRAMTSYAKMTRDFSRVDVGGPGGGELEAYRQWMESKAPIAVAETGFLRRENEGDLVTIKPPLNNAVDGEAGKGRRERERERERGRKSGVSRRAEGGGMNRGQSATAHNDIGDGDGDNDSSHDDDDDEFLSSNDTNTNSTALSKTKRRMQAATSTSTKVKGRGNGNGNGNGNAAAERQRQKAIILPLALLATIVVFKVVPHVFARLVISSMIAVAAASLVGTLTAEGWWKGWRKREGVVYVGVLVALASLVR